MPLYLLNDDLIFPPVELAEPDGLLAMGGDLSPERLLLAYRSGIFPWFNDDFPLWWSPDPRFVLFPGELHVSHSMKTLLNGNKFRFSINRAFSDVINHCRTISREGQPGTWITPEMKKAYIRLYELGFAHSAETWEEDKLVGGLYGVRIGRVFCGESMFSTASNASKFAFIRFVRELEEDGVELIDCQVYTQHLESLGARMIPRKEYLKFLG